MRNPDPIRTCYTFLNPDRGAVISLQASTSRIEPDIVVVRVSGNMTSSDGQLVIEPLVTDLLNENERKLIFDLSGVEHMDSTGANVVIQCFLAVRDAGGALRVASASARVARLFKMTRLDAVIPTYPTVAAACEGFTLTSQATH